MDPPIEQQPLVETAQATQFARRRPRIDAMVAQVFEEARDVLLYRGQQHRVPGFEELGKGSQVAQVGLAGERPQPLLHAQIGLIVAQQG